jgi:hypothetical protein
MKTPSSFEEMLGGCQYYNTLNFIKNKLSRNHCSDNLVNPPQTLHNYHLFKLPVKHFDNISLDRATSQVIL